MLPCNGLALGWAT